MTAIERCRTAALGGHVEQCGDCGHQRISFNSCRNRNCPKCQGLARAQWLEDRQAELLDVPYFHVVFTVPQEIEVIAFQNQTVIYNILFQAASETLRVIAAARRPVSWACCTPGDKIYCTIRMRTSLCLAAGSRPTATAGRHAGQDSFCPSQCCRRCF